MKEFNDIVSKTKVSGFETTAKNERDSKEWLDLSFEIALLISARLKELNWTQIQLAEKLQVSPQYVNKIVKGKENLTLATIAGLEKILTTKLISIEQHPVKSMTAQTSGISIFLGKANYSPVGMETKAEERKDFEFKQNEKNNFADAA
jgi:transcriptional regulator with XRE-family HTH domain